MVMQQMPLAMVGPQEVVTVVGVRAGRGLTQRLAEMGLTPGVTLKVLGGSRPGPVLVNLRGSRVALGFGVAQKIMVEKSRDG